MIVLLCNLAYMGSIYIHRNNIAYSLIIVFRYKIFLSVGVIESNFGACDSTKNFLMPFAVQTVSHHAQHVK